MRYSDDRRQRGVRKFRRTKGERYFFIVPSNKRQNRIGFLKYEFMKKVKKVYVTIKMEYTILQRKNTRIQEDCRMIEATSCGGVVIHRGKILALFKSYRNRYEGWVLPKGTVESGEVFEQTALREVKEEADVKATIVKYLGKSQYSFSVPEGIVNKEVHWYLMTADNYHSRPQREEYFVDSGYYKFHEVYHLLRFANEKQIVEKAYQEYQDLRYAGKWGKR